MGTFILFTNILPEAICCWLQTCSFYVVLLSTCIQFSCGNISRCIQFINA